MDLSQPTTGVTPMGSVKSGMPPRPVYSYDSEYWSESAASYTWPPATAPQVPRDSVLTSEHHNIPLREPVEAPKIKTEPSTVNDTTPSGVVPPDKWSQVQPQQMPPAMVSMALNDPNNPTLSRPEGTTVQEMPELPENLLTEAQMAAAQQNHMRRLVAAPGVMMPPPLPGGGEGQSDLFHKVPLGEKGRMELKAAIRAAMKERPELREKVNGIAKLRCATIPQLLRIAHICDLWDMALDISRRFVETRNGKQSRQAAIRKMAKSGCLIDRRLAPALSTTVTITAAPPQAASALSLNKGLPIRLISKPNGQILAPATFASGAPSEYTTAVCETANVANGTTSPGTSMSQSSTSANSINVEDGAGAWAIQGGGEAGYTAAVTAEWQPMEQSYYEMYNANGVYSAAPSSNRGTTQWATPLPQPANAHPAPTYYQTQVAPAPSTSCEASPVNAAALSVAECPTRVDGVCLYTIDHSLAHGVPPSVSSPPNENPAVEQLAAISQFGLWAAEATPGFV